MYQCVIISWPVSWHHCASKQQHKLCRAKFYDYHNRHFYLCWCISGEKISRNKLLKQTIQFLDYFAEDKDQVTFQPNGEFMKEELCQEKLYQTSTSKNLYISTHNRLKDQDRIERLPGQIDGIDFNQYSGYVTVDYHAGRALFCYFVESPRNRSSKPLVLWLNGGPACYFLGCGAMVELGPFRVNKDGKTLYRNQFARNADLSLEITLTFCTS